MDLKFDNNRWCIHYTNHKSAGSADRCFLFHTQSAAKPHFARATRNKLIMEFTTCKFFVEKKKRFCRVRASTASNFCSQHSTEGDKGRRISCPLDKKHF